MKVRFGDRYIERPFKQLVREAFAAPFLCALIVHTLLRGGWGH